MGHHLTLRSWFKSYFLNFIIVMIIIIITGNYTPQVRMPQGYQTDGCNPWITHRLCKQTQTWRAGAGRCVPGQRHRTEQPMGTLPSRGECNSLTKSPFTPPPGSAATGRILTSEKQRLPWPSQVWICVSVNEIMAPNFRSSWSAPNTANISHGDTFRVFFQPEL